MSMVGQVVARPTLLAWAVFQACGPAWAQSELPEPWPTAVLAPSGYLGAINTPSAHVLPWGGAAAGVTNSNPEHARTLRAGSFGSLNAGLGLLPGLELVGRLAYEGDLNCNLYSSTCGGGQRDLSLSGKYQLPLELPLDTRLALGFTDYGGAATQYRQVYGVATSTWGPLDLSLGYGKPKAASALLDGPFGSAVLRIDERWSAALEHDSRAARLGIAWRQPLTRDLALQLGASRKLAGDAPQQPWQLSAALNLALGWVPDPAQRPTVTSGPTFTPATAATAPIVSTTPVQSVPGPAAPPDPVAPAVSPAPALPATADSLLQALLAQGFVQVRVEYWPAQEGQPAVWRVQAEPRRWRQSQIDALGVALAYWLKTVIPKESPEQPTDELLMTLTWQREPVLHAYTSASCLDGWVKGWTVCGDRRADSPALVLSRDLAGVGPRLAAIEALVQQAPAVLAVSEGSPSWMPQFEIGPGLRNTVGSEYGLYDYSLALELGSEVNLAPGLFWQGVLSAPVSKSDDFSPGRAFASDAHARTGLEQSLLSYWRTLPLGFAGQLTAGQFSRSERGGQADALWMTADGRWRFSGSVARYTSDQDAWIREPILGNVRWGLVPGTWDLEATAGRFVGGDEGYRFASHHWFGDTRMTLFYRKSENPIRWSMPSRSFVGFELSLPLGSEAVWTQAGPSIRGRDRWSWGLQTKVGEDDNRITRGYGRIPELRHGLMTDVTDFDRNGTDSLYAQSARLRAAILRVK